MGISAVILTHDSARTLASTLKSVKFCDEIIVVDDGSSDQTKRIASAHNARVYERRLRGDFATQRNFGLSKASGPWVLFVDSDETVPAPLAAEIREVIRGATVVGWYLRRTDLLWGKALTHGETGNIRLLRLAKKGAGTWTRPVHETWDIAGTTAFLTHPIHHTPHQTVAEFVADINAYSTINAEYFYRVGVRSNLWQVIAYPLAKFIQNYLFRLGFLDGTPGAVVAFMMSFHSYLTRAKLWQLSHPRKQA